MINALGTNRDYFSSTLSISLNHILRNVNKKNKNNKVYIRRRGRDGKIFTSTSILYLLRKYFLRITREFKINLLQKKSILIVRYWIVMEMSSFQCIKNNPSFEYVISGVFDHLSTCS